MSIANHPARAPRASLDLPAIAGLEAAIGRAGFYKHERPDLLLMRMPAGTKAGAGVFTTNAVGSAPTDWCKQALSATRGGAARGGLLVNAGCANLAHRPRWRRGMQARARRKLARPSLSNRARCSRPPPA